MILLRSFVLLLPATSAEIDCNIFLSKGISKRIFFFLNRSARHFASYASIKRVYTETRSEILLLLVKSIRSGLSCCLFIESLKHTELIFCPFNKYRSETKVNLDISWLYVKKKSRFQSFNSSSVGGAKYES